MEILKDYFASLDLSYLMSMILRLASVLLCLSVHEACHGFAAYALGDQTAKRQHRLSLNPLRHIDWFGLAAMLLCGFGWARPVQVDMRYFKKPKWGMALTALAGPVSNILLSVLLLLLLRFTGNFISAELFKFIGDTAYLSVGLGIFNLLPIPPLDGSKVLFAFLPEKAYNTLMRYERYGFIILFALVAFNIGSEALTQIIRNVFLTLALILV